MVPTDPVSEFLEPKMLLLLQGRVHRAALPRPRGCAEVTALLGGLGWGPSSHIMLGFTPRLPIPEPREQNNPAGLVMLGTPLHLLLPEELSAIPFIHTLLCLLPPQAIKPSGKRLPGCRKACCRVFP